MDKVTFVKNIKKHCERKGVKPTVACRESGVGSSFVNNIESRGQTPSVEKVEMLAHYLGTTVSELIGETASSRDALDLDTPLTLRDSAVVLKPDDFKWLTLAEVEMIMAYRVASADDQQAVSLILKKYKEEEIQRKRKHRIHWLKLIECGE